MQDLSCFNFSEFIQMRNKDAVFNCFLKKKSTLKTIAIQIFCIFLSHLKHTTAHPLGLWVLHPWVLYPQIQPNADQINLEKKNLRKFPKAKLEFATWPAPSWIHGNEAMCRHTLCCPALKYSLPTGHCSRTLSPTQITRGSGEMA